MTAGAAAGQQGSRYEVQFQGYSKSKCVYTRPSSWHRGLRHADRQEVSFGAYMASLSTPPSAVTTQKRKRAAEQNEVLKAMHYIVYVALLLNESQHTA